MAVVNKKEPIILGLGDIIILAASLLGALILRRTGFPEASVIESHIFPFSIIFAYSIIVFYITGLYGRMAFLVRSSIPAAVIRAQIANGLIAVLLFYFVPQFSLTPKITLFFYICLSSLVLILWRLNAYPLLSLRRKQPALIIAAGPEAEELIAELAVNPRSPLYGHRIIAPKELSRASILTEGEGTAAIRYIIADMNDPAVDAVLPELYRHFFPQARIIDISQLYEDIFDRIPLSCMNYAWIMSNVSSITPRIYDTAKRALDIILGAIVGIAALIAYPFVALAIKLEDKGPVFIAQERIGKGNKIFRMYKFRSMQSNDGGIWLKDSPNKVTRVGMFIRKSRIDELPQALSILRGDMSLIGPRADIIDLGKRLEHEISYYSVRNVITPGLTGWAQVSQEKPPQSVEETKLRLSYDLYYIKHRSFGLDLIIVLRTVKTLLSRVGM